jgi:hypothetical protein
VFSAHAGTTPQTVQFYVDVQHTIADNTPNKIGSKYLSLRQKLAGENNINKAPVRTEQLSNGRQASGKKAKGAHGRLHNSNKLWRH